MTNENIDETFNIKKATDVTIGHLKELYEEFEDWDLVLVAYLIGAEDLEDIINEQDQTTFDDLYLETYATSWYYEVMAYKYIMENISDYINTKNIKAYSKKKTEFIKQ
jgi:hypothetical protein